MSQTKSHIIVTQVGNNQMTVKDVGTSEDYPQIQIVNAVGNSDPEENKSKLIFIGTGDDGTELFSQEDGSTYALTPSDESGTVSSSVIEVTHHDQVITDGDVSDGKAWFREAKDGDVISDGKAWFREAKVEGVEEVQEFTFVDGVGLEDEQPEPQKDFECELCHKRFTKVEILKRHIKTHLKDKEFKCGYCNKAFDRRDVLNDHIRNHTGEKPFECNICKKKFTRGFVLLRHMRTHGEGLYKCEYCLKGFDRKDTFRDHMRNHTGEKPFKCKFCGKSFSRSFVLTKHEKSHIIREEMNANHLNENPIDVEFVDTDNVEIQEVDFEDEQSVKQATDLLLQKELGEEVIEGEVEQEIIQDEHDFKVIEPHDIVTTEVDEANMQVEQVEEVVETEAITLATADGQIVRVISKEQYERLLTVASKSKTYKCDTCNRRFTNINAFQNHYNLRWEEGGCIN